MELLKLYSTKAILHKTNISRLYHGGTALLRISHRTPAADIGSRKSQQSIMITGKRTLHTMKHLNKLDRRNLNPCLTRIWQIIQYSTSAADDKHDQDVINTADVKSLVDTLVENASELDKMVNSISKSVLHKHVKYLLDKGINENNLKRLCADPDALRNLPNFVALIDTLYEHGFTVDNVLRLVKDYPSVINLDKLKFVSVFNELHNAGFQSDRINSMILKCPALLDCDLPSKLTMIDKLKLLFKKKDSLKLVEQSPDILFKDMDYIMERFNFVFHQMGITQPQMMCSNLFSHSMEHIRARYMFVVRAGYFMKVKKDKGQQDYNPTLDTIIDSTDAKFAKQFGNMTSTDYRTFKKLLSKETTLTVDD